MSLISLSEFASRCGGGLSSGASGEISGFATDNREVKPRNLFICIKGENVDGHDFSDKAFSEGAIACLCTKPIKGPHIVVDDISSALANFGRSKRAEFNRPVVAITGSAGKTTTKEFVAAACSPLGRIVKSQGNRNTEYTSPLLWAEVGADTAAVVVEMGMRGEGQIAHLASIAQPTVGVVTQIGTSHLEMVSSRAGIARAKSELLKALPKDGTAVLWQEDVFLDELKKAAPCNARTFGFSQEADCRVLGYRSINWEECYIKGTLDGIEFETEVPTIGRHQALNIAAAILASSACGVGVTDAVAKIPSATLPPLRLQVVERGGATFVLDTYNASPDSTVAALATLAELPAMGRKIAVLGEMKELGQSTETGHRRVGAALAESMVDKALLTGGPTRFIADEALKTGFPKDRIEELVEFDIAKVREFLKCVRDGDTVLIKGSRALGLERAVEVAHK